MAPIRTENSSCETLSLYATTVARIGGTTRLRRPVDVSSSIATFVPKDRALSSSEICVMNRVLDPRMKVVTTTAPI